MSSLILKPSNSSDYHSDTSRISKSGLDVINRSPLHYWHKYLNPENTERGEKKSTALEFGSLLHCLVFEEDEFNRLYAFLPPNMPRKPTSAQREAKNPSKETVASIARWDEFIAENAGKIIVDEDDARQAFGMRDMLYNHPTFDMLMHSGTAEQRVNFEVPDIYAQCKLKYDWLSDLGFVVDLKTTENASAAAFIRSISEYRYHVQDAFYTDGLFYGLGASIKGFIFAAIEKSPPYAMQLHSLDGAAIAQGRKVYQANLRTYMECLERDEWPGYPEDITVLSLPSWATR